jgi:DUF4097 and DUF4098 domain-containing protein YvlB
MGTKTQVTVLLVLALTSFNAAAASETLHREHSFDATNGMTVTVDVSFHTVEIVARPGDTVDVTVDLDISGSDKKVQKAIALLEPVFQQDSDGVLIRSTKKGFSGFGSAKVKGRVVVMTPPDLHVTVDSSSGSTTLTGDFGSAHIMCDASSGRFHINGAAQTVFTDLSSGSVLIELTRPAKSVRADTSSGSVTLKGGAGSFHADTSSGSIKADGLLGNASMNTSSGSITAAWSAIPPDATVVAETSSGSVNLTFPTGTVLKGSVGTSSGGIRSDFPGETSDRGHQLELYGGSGAVHLEVGTSSGGVSLRAP